MIPMQVRQAKIGMLFRYSHLSGLPMTYIIIGEPFVAHGASVVKAHCVDTGETRTFNNWMFRDIELLETNND